MRAFLTARPPLILSVDRERGRDKPGPRRAVRRAGRLRAQLWSCAIFRVDLCRARLRSAPALQRQSTHGSCVKPPFRVSVMDRVRHGWCACMRGCTSLGRTASQAHPNSSGRPSRKAPPPRSGPPSAPPPKRSPVSIAKTVTSPSARRIPTPVLACAATRSTVIMRRRSGRSAKKWSAKASDLAALSSRLPAVN